MPKNIDAERYWCQKILMAENDWCQNYWYQKLLMPKNIDAKRYWCLKKPGWKISTGPLKKFAHSLHKSTPSNLGRQLIYVAKLRLLETIPASKRRLPVKLDPQTPGTEVSVRMGKKNINCCFSKNALWQNLPPLGWLAA